MMENQNLHRIQRVSACFRLLFSILIFIIPLLTVIFWLSFNHLPQSFKGELPVQVSQPLSVSAICLAILVSLVPTGIGMYALATLRKLFSLYQQATIFTVANVDCYRNLGYALIYWGLAKITFIPLISIVLSYHKLPGQRTLVLGIGSSDLATLLMGAIVVTISWVMYEASRLEDEHIHTV